MGACLCRGHKELHLALSTLHHTEEVPSSPVKDGQNPSNGSVADKSNRYDIGQLATSSLIGLVATIKDHITKPTAMAQGRVAHLIEWKGWGGGGGGEAAGGRGGWSGAWGKGGMGLQEDEQFYSQMTDEIKEARFAAGVAEQFALAEAAMNMWSLTDSYEQPSTSLQAPQSHFMSHFLLDGGSVGVPQHLYSIHSQTPGTSQTLATSQTRGSSQTPGTSQTLATSLVLPLHTNSTSPLSNPQQDGEASFENRCAPTAQSGVRHVDSSSPSEDEVFYN